MDGAFLLLFVASWLGSATSQDSAATVITASQLHKALQNESIQSILLATSIVVNPARDWPDVVQVSRNITLAAYPSLREGAVYAQLDYANAQMLIALAPGVTLTYVGLEVLNSMDLFGLSHQPLRFSPNATLRWERCVVRRRVGWSPEASLLNLLAAPRPADEPGPQSAWLSSTAAGARVTYASTTGPSGADTSWHSPAAFSAPRRVSGWSDWVAGVMAAPPPPLQVMVDTWYVVENWVSEDCMRRKSGVEEGDDEDDEGADGSSEVFEGLEANTDLPRWSPAAQEVPGAHSGRFSRASSHSGRLKPALSVVLADEDPDQEAGEGGGEVVRVSPAGEAPALAPADMAAELTRLAAELRGNVRDTAIRLDAIIGSGSFGTVYRGTWQGLPVAIKTVVFSTSATSRRRALQEAALCQSINHPNVIVSADLNPNNVLLKRDPGEPSGYGVKVGDFGLSVMLPLNRTHLSNMRMGTMFYMCPAVVLKAQVGPASDVFSLGVMLWELYHGRRAGVRTKEGPRYCSIFPAFPPSCPEAYRIVTLHCLQRQPQNRPPAEAVVRHLESLAVALRAAAALRPYASEPSRGFGNPHAQVQAQAPASRGEGPAGFYPANGLAGCTRPLAS
eukprot:XP_001697408.1 serine/threonine protein kinase 5 [Chlamydomonas reinhardtii]